jgi:hypothetical protein
MTKSGNQNCIRQTLESGFVLYGNNQMEKIDDYMEKGPISEQKKAIKCKMLSLLAFKMHDSLLSTPTFLSRILSSSISRISPDHHHVVALFCFQLKISCVEIIILSILALSHFVKTKQIVHHNVKTSN